MSNIMISWNNSEIVNWVLAVITFAAVLVAIFQDHIKNYFWKPKIQLELRVKPPDCHKIKIHKYNNSGHILASSDSYFFRMRVKNIGTINAKRVEIQANSLSKKIDDSFTQISGFTPMNFVVTHSHERYFESISPEMEKLCDLFHILEPINGQSFVPFQINGPVMWFDVEVNPSDYSNIICEPGLYKLDIVVGGSNVTRPIIKSMLIEFSGKWMEDEHLMLGKEIKLKLLD